MKIKKKPTLKLNKPSKKEVEEVFNNHDIKPEEPEEVIEEKEIDVDESKVIKSPSKINIERGIISKLLETGEMSIVKDKQIKAYYFSKDNREVMKYLEDYFMKNGSLPTPRVFQTKFPKFSLEGTKDKKIGTDEPLEYWCDELRKKITHNTLCDNMEEVFKLLENFDTEGATNLIKKTMLHIENDLVETSAIDMTKDAEDRKLIYKKRKENKGMIGIPTGIDKLDLILKGIQPKQLVTTIAKTGVGKTWLYILMACYCQLNNYRVLFLTTEMSEEQIEDRLEAMHMGMMYKDFNYNKFKSGTLSPEEEANYFEYLDKKDKLEPLIIETATGASNVNAKIQQYNPDIIFIDSAYLMEDDRGSDQDWLRIAHITRDLKMLAKRTGKPICINSQADSTTCKKTGPELENIGFSRAIGHDSDVVLALFRDEEMIEDREMKLKVLKQREGILGSVMLNWDFSTMDFSTIYSDQDSKTVTTGDRGSDYVTIT